MIYVFFAVEHYPFPLAKHLIDEGNEVIVGQVVNRGAELAIPGSEDKEKPEDRALRLSYYDGIIQKYKASDVMEILSKVKDSEKNNYFIFFDYNDMFNMAHKVIDMGFKHGLLPTALYYRLEEEREFAKEFAKKYLPDVQVAEYDKFKKADEGIKFVNESEHILVLKSNGKAGDTIVPKTANLETAKKQLTALLEKNRKQYEQNGFILEKKIDNCLEVAPVMVFYNGKPVYSLVEFENKEFGAGNIGPLKGGNLVVSVRTELDAKINQIAFPEMIHKMAAQHPGIGVYDAGLLWNGEAFWFTEFCGMRYGWDGIISEIAMGDKGKPFVTNYFQSLVDGKNPLLNKFGVGVRLFNYEGHTHDSEKAKSDLPIRIEGDIDNNLFLYRVKMKDGELVSIGDQDMLGVVSAGGDTLEEAASRTYDMVKQVEFDKLYYRPMFDLLSTDYETSVINRMNAVKDFI